MAIKFDNIELINLQNHAGNNVLTLNGSNTNVTFSGTVTATHFYGDGSNLTNISASDNTKLPLAGGTMSGNITMSGNSISMGNGSITGANTITINDPGYQEGITWNNGNGWGIWESPDNMANSAGSLQFSVGTTRQMTLDTSGVLETKSAQIVNNTTGSCVAHWSTSGTSTGAIKVTIPGTHSSNWSMLILRVAVYEYNGNEHTIFYVSGHDWTSGWYNNGVTKWGDSDKEISVAYDSNDDYIIIGGVSSTWSYGHVTVDVVAHPSFYHSAMDITSGWAISQVTSLSGITVQSVTNKLVADRAWVNAQGFLTSGSITETDTLATVTGRGATTTTSCTFNTITMNTPVVGSSNKIKFANNDYIRFDDANGVGRFHFDCDGSTNNASVQAATFVGALSGTATNADKLDNIDSTSFLRSDTNDSFTGDELHFPTLDLSISNNNSQNQGNTYFRGTGTHFVLGLNSGNTLYLNYGNSAGQFRAYGNAMYWNDNNIGTPWGSGNDGSGTGLDADLVDGHHADRFFRRIAKASANVGPGWVTVAENTSGRKAGEIIVTDADSGDHAYIRIEWLRSYADSHWTVLNTGGHSNRITGIRVLRDSDDTYGNKKLQIYCTVQSTYEVNIYEQGDIDDYAGHSVVTPVVQASISGYVVEGNSYQNLDTYPFSVDQGIQGLKVRTDTDFSLSSGGKLIWENGYGNPFIQDYYGSLNLSGSVYIGTGSAQANGNLYAGGLYVGTSNHVWHEGSTGLGGTNRITDLSNANNSVPSGFYQYYNGSNYPSANTWYNLLNVRHSNTANDHGFQIAASYYDENIWTRTYSGGSGANNGTYTTWRRLFHEGHTPTPSEVGAVAKTGDTMTGTLSSSNNGAAIQMDGGGSAEGIRMQPDSSTTYPVFLRSLNPGSGEASPWIYKEQATQWGIWHNNPNNSIDFTRSPSTGIADDVGGGDNTVMMRLDMAAGMGQFMKVRTHYNGSQAAPRYDTSFYVAQSKHYYGQTSSEGMYLGESGNDIYIRGQLAIGGTAIQSGYALTMTGSIDLNANSIDYVNQLHFNDNVRFYDDGNDNYLNYKWGDTGGGGMKFRDGDGALMGYIYGDGGDQFGLLDADGNWAVRIDRDVCVDLLVNNQSRILCDTGGTEFRSGSTTVGEVTTSGVARFASDVVAYYSFSDQQLKTNIKPTTNNLDKILKLEPVEYTWKDGGREGKKEIGLIAQDVEKVVPEVVRENERLNDNTLYKQVDYEHLVSTLIGAIQEQQDQIAELKSEVTNLKSTMCECKK